MKSATKFKRIKLTPVDVIKPMVALLILNVIVLTVWTVTDPLVRETIVVSKDTFDRNVETYGVCSSEHGSIFLAVLCIINIGSLLFAVIEAYKARNISTELQESSYIFTAMAIILLVSFIGVPVLIIAHETNAYYFVVVGIVFVVCSSILLLIFIPKIQAVRKPQAGGHGFGSLGNMLSTLRTASAESLEDDGIRIYDVKLALVQMESEIRQLKQLLSTENRLPDDFGNINIDGVNNLTVENIRARANESLKSSSNTPGKMNEIMPASAPPTTVDMPGIKNDIIHRASEEEIQEETFYDCEQQHEYEP